MYKVLIADDEDKVCKLIYHLVDWEQFGLTVAAMVNDGVSALQFIQEEKPDIVITDIRMPGYDGIELIRKAKEYNPEINFIIVSGYRHFDYAHNAIKYGVEDYLLKPLKKAEFITTLTKMVQKKETMMQLVHETEDYKRRVNQGDQMMKQTFLDRLLINPSFIKSGITREMINTEFHCNFINGYYQGIIIKPDLTIENEGEQTYDLLLEKGKDIAVKQFAQCYQEVIITIAKEGIICILNDTMEQMQGIRKYLKQIRSDILHMRDVFLNVRVTIGIGEAVTEITEIAATLRGAKSAVLNRLLQGTGHLLSGINETQGAVSPYDLIDSNFRTKLLICIETLNSDGITSLINELMEKLFHMKKVDGELIFTMCCEIYDIFAFGMAKDYNVGKDVINKEEYERQFYHCDTVQEVFQQLIVVMTTKLEQLNLEKQLADKKPIRLAKQYIKEKYQQPITLDEISNEIGFNPTYFSTLFKKETGQNFLEYLTDTRIQAAKQLLADTDRTVIQVSEEVGYTDLKYFTKLFKKSTGLTPSEYRKLYY
ncbi:MAG: two component transcriptional regulator, AraC family [Herbinix sp.]|jgi:two-component system response regulator YesN|nr:two component transcriptional regulator, AraC family [Herbinix sp.]